jgi:predicted DNA-binding protein (UPF0251 family)
MKRAIVCLFGFLLFPSPAYALSCNQWYDTMDSFISESKQINGVLKSIKDDAPARCTYNRETRIPIMQRNLKVIRLFYGCNGQTGAAAKQTGVSIQRMLKRIVNDTSSKCAAAGM